MKFLVALAIAFLIMSAPVLTAQNRHSNGLKSNVSTLFSFDNRSSARQWTIVNDGVMGGISESQFTINTDATASFSGTISLENNGGFASTRTRSRDFKLGGTTGIQLRIKGDGKKYQFRVRTNGNFDGISYRHEFKTTAGIWTTVTLPFKDFVPAFRGRVLRQVGPVSPDKIQQLGFLIADKQEGNFKLEIDWIKTWKSSPDIESDSNKNRPKTIRF